MKLLRPTHPNHGAPVSWSDLQGGKTGAQKWRSAVAAPRIDSYSQAVFLAFGGMAFAAGFGASLAFSFIHPIQLRIQQAFAISSTMLVDALRSGNAEAP